MGELEGAKKNFEKLFRQKWADEYGDLIFLEGGFLVQREEIYPDSEGLLASTKINDIPIEVCEYLSKADFDYGIDLLTGISIMPTILMLEQGVREVKIIELDRKRYLLYLFVLSEIGMLRDILGEDAPLGRVKEAAANHILTAFRASFTEETYLYILKRLSKMLEDELDTVPNVSLGIVSKTLTSFAQELGIERYPFSKFSKGIPPAEGTPLIFSNMGFRWLLYFKNKVPLPQNKFENLAGGIQSMIGKGAKAILIDREEYILDFAEFLTGKRFQSTGQLDGEISGYLFRGRSYLVRDFPFSGKKGDIFVRKK